MPPATLSMEIVSDRVTRFFSRSMRETLRAHFDGCGIAVTLRDLRDAPVPTLADIVLLLSHVRKGEPVYLTALRASGYKGVIAGWFWDNHHAKDANRKVAALVDVAIAAHDCHARYLRKSSTLLPSVMLCATQWTGDEAGTYWSALPKTSERRPDLYGGFFRYAGSRRSACLDELMATGQHPALRYVNTEREGYFELSGEARFREWARFAVSLCLPYRNDLSNRFFDAWLTGQIPVVTPDIADLTAPWALEHRDRHFVCAASYSRVDIEAAHQRALDLFRAGGVEAQEARHRMVIEGHLFHHRIERIVQMLGCADGHSDDPPRQRAGQ